MSTGTFFAPGEMESGYIGGLKLPDWIPRIEVKSKTPTTGVEVTQIAAGCDKSA